VGLPTGNVWCEIWSDNGSDKPNAKIGASSANVNVATLGTDTGGTYITFTWSTAIPVTVGTKYWIIFNGDFTVSSTNYALWKYLSTGGYTGGIMGWSGDSGANWTTNANTDFNFKEYGDPLANSMFFNQI
jgi:hypothetical protein